MEKTFLQYSKHSFSSTDVYNISNSRGRVARLTLFKNHFKLGEDILGTMDFDHTDIPCVQFTVTLQSEEILNSSYRRKSGQLANITAYTKQAEFCLSTSQSYLSLSIPLSCTPSFSMDLGKCQHHVFCPLHIDYSFSFFTMEIAF